MAVFQVQASTPTIIDLDAEVSQYFKTKESLGKALVDSTPGKPYVETASGDTYARPIKITPPRDGDGYEVPKILIQPEATV